MQLFAPVAPTILPRIIPPRLVASATDPTVTPNNPFPDAVNLPMVVPRYGQDLTFGLRRPAPGRQNVGATPGDLAVRMRRLVAIFAEGDDTGMARQLVDSFLMPQRGVTYYEDPALNAVAGEHGRIRNWITAALGPPSAPPPGRVVRIHQALRTAGWDLQRLVPPRDLGVPAFNGCLLGNVGNPTFCRALRLGDYDSGLGLMINGVQYVYVLATHYQHDAAAGRYHIRLRSLFYDVFGLDDIDLQSFGASADGWTQSDAAIGITAWWQLQHQHGYAPLVTRIMVDREFTVSYR